MRNLILLVFMLTLGVTLSAQDKQNDWAQYSRYEQQNKGLKKRPKVVFMGDSITDFWVNESPDFFTTNDYLGRGISGQTTSEMLVRFRADVINLKPEVVVILAGTNDVAENLGKISPEYVMDNIKSMCELADANDIEVVLCSIMPCDTFVWRPEIDCATKIVGLNKMIKSYAKREGIEYVDYHKQLANSTNGLDKSMSEDGCHPTKACYTVMEEIVKKGIINAIRD